MFKDEKEYYLVFSSYEDHPFFRWLEPGFCHVHLIFSDNGNWILLDPSLSSLNLRSLPKAYNLDLMRTYRKLNPDHTIIHLKINDTPALNVLRCGSISCVSTIQYLLGIYWPLTVTPYGLYSKLLAHTPSHIRIIYDGKQQESGEGS